MQPVTRELVPRFLSPRFRLISGLLFVIISILVLAGAISIPFLYESSTILYKFGLDRLLLRSGQVAGLMTGCLLLLQVILSARLKCLDRVFGFGNLFKFHRMFGVLIACLAIIHPILVFIPESRLFIPLQFRYWPEFVGFFLLALIIAVVISSRWRARLGISYHRWRPFHRVAAILITAGFGVHVLSVSETFEQKLPKAFAFGAICFWGLIFIWDRTRSLRDRRKFLSVSEIKPAGDHAVCLKIVSNSNKIPAYLPGQFGFITVFSAHISKEEHPFSIASTPTRSTNLEFIVRTTGDWTKKINRLQPGNRVLMNGPFGQFSHLRLGGNKDIIMIAGGIGITPMLGMLRYMADRNDRRSITLIWSNQTIRRVIFPHEFRNLSAQLKGLQILHILTRDSEYRGEKGRLDQPTLKRLLSGCSFSSAVFICGPAQMIKDVRRHLVSMGFQKRMIFTERFSL